MFTHSFDVISIGAATVDIFVKSNDFSVSHQELVLPYSAKTEITQSFIGSGGGATNSAVAFARLGLKSAAVSLVGSDPLSHYVYQDLVANHVDTSLISQEKNSSDFSVVLIAPDGGRTILTNRGSTCLQEKHLAWSSLKSTRWLYITSLEGNLNLLEKIIGFAREHHLKISLNPGNRELAQPKLLKPLLPFVDFLLLNKTEAQTIIHSDYSDPNFWQKLKALGSPIVAVTKGRDGAHILATQDYYSPIINTQPVDETGAGDGFGSTFVAALIHGCDLPTALHWAIKNSASVVSFLGAKPGLLTLKEITRHPAYASQTRKSPKTKIQKR
ncbi:carbohydrate kinase family protein [Patescibacteria group bacterium]|nr:carbohydrate kinase family protein [Patescibacteria group bacterium]